MAGHVTVFIAYSPGLNTPTARTLAERDNSKLVMNAVRARNMKEGESGIPMSRQGRVRKLLYSGGDELHKTATIVSTEYRSVVAQVPVPSDELKPISIP